MATKKTARKPARKPVAARKAPAKKAAVKKSAAKPVKQAAAADLHRAVEQFLYRQSELLDGKQWQDYINLFDPKGVYWAPLLPEHTHWDGVPSIFVEDVDLMTVRMKRIQHPNAWSQQAEWCTTHVVSNVVIERVTATEVHVRSRFHMMELRRDDLRHFGGTYRHQLKRTKDGFRILLQRADLFNAQAPFEYVLQIWV